MPRAGPLLLPPQPTSHQGRSEPPREIQGDSMCMSNFTVKKFELESATAVVQTAAGTFLIAVFIIVFICGPRPGMRSLTVPSWQQPRHIVFPAVRIEWGRVAPIGPSGRKTAPPCACKSSSCPLAGGAPPAPRLATQAAHSPTRLPRCRDPSWLALSSLTPSSLTCHPSRGGQTVNSASIPLQFRCYS
jgi:hypothetical protein